MSDATKHDNIDELAGRLDRLADRLDKHLASGDRPAPPREFDGQASIPIPPPDPEAERRLRKSINKQGAWH